MALGLFQQDKGKDPAEVAESMRQDYRITFGTETGRRVLGDLIGRCHLFEPSYSPQDPGETEFREGERNVLLYILSRVQLPEKEIIEEVIENG